MPFSDDLVSEAWKRAGGKCECGRTTHGHQGTCGNTLTWANRGRNWGTEAWEAHTRPRTHRVAQIHCRTVKYSVGTVIQRRYRASVANTNLFIADSLFFQSTAVIWIGPVNRTEQPEKKGKIGRSTVKVTVPTYSPPDEF